ncbi:MAG: FAD-dependent monooxygenase [Leadbetterella sp.]
MEKTINIVGAGIGGLTTALALKQKGICVNIFEGSSEIKPVGAGIILANNAMQVFQKLGLQDKIEKVGNKISCMKITDEKLNDISVVDLTEYEKTYGVQNIAIHRGELQKILASEIGFENINLSKRLSRIEKGECYKLIFEDQSIVESQVIIGADGINSVIRNQLFEKSSIRNANQTCWRGICEIDLPQKYNLELNEAWGKGKRFGFVKISNKKVYWYALASSKNKDLAHINLEEYFKEFHEDILILIKATAKEQILVSDIQDLKSIETWHCENVCLIGDAAHATTPNLGQGACQAIEDAYALGKLLSNGFSIENTFKDYERIRRKKANKIVNTSWTLGKIAHWENPILVWLRNTAFRFTPNSVNKKQMDEIFKLTSGL